MRHRRRAFTPQRLLLSMTRCPLLLAANVPFAARLPFQLPPSPRSHCVRVVAAWALRPPENYTWPGSNWRPSACEADVIATRPQVLWSHAQRRCASTIWAKPRAHNVIECSLGLRLESAGLSRRLGRKRAHASAKRCTCIRRASRVHPSSLNLAKVRRMLFGREMGRKRFAFYISFGPRKTM